MTLDLSRRSFLLGFSVAGIVAAAGMPIVGALAAPEAWVDREMGYAVPFTSTMSVPNGWATTVDFISQRVLIPAARKHLPPGTRYDLRLKVPTDYGRSHGVAWYHHPDMTKAETWGGYKVPGEPIAWRPPPHCGATIAELTV